MQRIKKAALSRTKKNWCNQLKVALEDINSTIFGHAEFVNFGKNVTALFLQWKEHNIVRLRNIANSEHPKILIKSLSETLLEVFQQASLLDPFDVYQHLMTYWAETMQDDVYMIVSDGWSGANKLRLIVEDKVTKVSLKARLAIIKRDQDAEDERSVLSNYLDLIEKEAVAKKKLSNAQDELMVRVAAQYGKLTEEEIKTLVIEDKWLAALSNHVQSEMNRVSQFLSGRINELAERYASPLSIIEQEVECYKLKVENHLRRMGFEWEVVTLKCEGVVS